MELIISFFLLITGIGLLISMELFRYTEKWHRWRKHKYRIIQMTIVVIYSDEPLIKYAIQRKRCFGFGWKENPNIPRYDSDGKLQMYHTVYYDTLQECQQWMDGIVAVVSGNPARKENVVG